MEKNQLWYVAKRAESMAIMMLTRLSNVHVQQFERDYGLDLLVSIGTKSFGRVFGIEVKGTINISSFISRNGTLKKRVLKQIRSMVVEYPFPIGIFVFDMNEDNGYFSWITAPIVTATGSAVTTIQDPVSLVPLKTEMIEQIIKQVNNWYDNRQIG